MKKMITLYADKGKVLTNGIDFGTVISLAEEVSTDGYYEIDKKEYEKFLEQQMNEELNT